MEFEIDTGSGILLMSEKMYRTYFLNEQLHNSNVVINPLSAKRRIYIPREFSCLVTTQCIYLKLSSSQTRLF